MEILKIEAKSRTLHGRKNYILRNENQVPAVVYGFGLDKSLEISVDHNTFVKLFRTAGESTLIKLQIDEQKELDILIQDVQRNALTDDFIHIDFRSVDTNKFIEAVAKLSFVGESPAVKALGGTLVRPIENISIKALPQNLVAVIEVDLTKLKTFDDVVRISDLDLPEGVEIMEDNHRTIAVVSAPRSQEEMDALDKVEENVVADVAVEGEKTEEEVSSEEKTEESK